MKLLVIASPHVYENRRMRLEGRKLGHKVTIRRFREIDFDLRGESTKVLMSGKSFEKQFDAVYFRHFPPSLIPEALLLAAWSKTKGIYVFEPSMADGSFVRSKIYDYWKLLDAGLPIPKSIQTLKLDRAGKYLKGFSWPIVAKGIHGSRGKYVYLLDNAKETKKYLSDALVGFFTFQEYLEIEAEYRIIVIGGKAVGAMRKYSPEGDFRHNVAVGASGEKATVPAAWNRIAEKAVKTLGYGLSGVDLAIVGKKPYLLEVNRTPAFAEFEKVTGVNVAKLFIQHVAKNRHRRTAKRR
ncbi:MAG: ATP-grasp domain-containing protein [Patescibacteria group bacterium]|jgi:RimK family alpha-L-glutamate ligase